MLALPRRRAFSFIALFFLATLSVYLYLSDAIRFEPHHHQPAPLNAPPPKVWSEPPYKTPIPDKYYNLANSTRRASAAIVILCRNSNLSAVQMSMAFLEQKFNHEFNYPYVFLNEVPFTDDFKRSISAATRATVEFGLIEHDHWFQPDSIDERKAERMRKKMAAGGVLYGDSVPYRNMCRFQSGFFFRHPLLAKYKWYWRVEPDVQFFCDIDFDPFSFMEGEDKRYAFTISMPEHKKTVRTLWPSIQEFIQANPTLLAPDNALGMLTETTRLGQFWNFCHFWSNFEIGDLDLWRSDAYLKFFDFLDQKGGFYYERWGDAPVHTFGAALFARKDQIHFFDEIGYWHIPYTHCPSGAAHARGRCTCEAKDSFDRHGWSCLNRYDQLFAPSEGSS